MRLLQTWRSNLFTLVPKPVKKDLLLYVQSYNRRSFFIPLDDRERAVEQEVTPLVCGLFPIYYGATIVSTVSLHLLGVR